MDIHLTDLKKSFGSNMAVDIPSFTIRQGEILGLVGNNGAGKTTLFRLMLDLLKATEGEVSYVIGPEEVPFCGITEPCTINPAQSEAWKEFTGAYLDEGFLIDFLTPEEYLDFLAKVNGLPPLKIKAAADGSESSEGSESSDNSENSENSESSESSENSEGSEKSDPAATFCRFSSGEIFGKKKLIRDYSAGNKQKIGIIAALFAQPRLIILDEPFNFLDPSGQLLLKKMLVEYNRRYHATILLSSHNLQHTVDISTRIALLEHGRIVEDLNNEDGSAAKALESYFQV